MSKDKEAPKKKSSLLKKLIIGFLGLVVTIVAIVTIVCVFFLKPIVRSQLAKRTGYDVKIEKLSLNPFTANFVLDGFVITNPTADFKTPGFVDLQALRGQIKLFSLFSDTLVVESATLDLPSVTLVQRPDKQPSNAELFATRLVGETSPAQPAEKPADKPAADSKPMQFHIKSLDVNLGKVVVASEAADGKITSRDYNINYKHSYKDITEAKQFMTTDLAKSLLGVGSQLTDLIPGEFGESVNSVLKGGIKVLDNPEAAKGEAVKSLLNKLAPKKKE